MPSTELEARVLELINKRTEPTPDGRQDASGNLYTGTGRLKQEASKNNIDCTKSDLEVAVAGLKAAGEVITWHGLLAPATTDYLEAIIENERKAGITRSLLIGKCERRLVTGGDAQ